MCELGQRSRGRRSQTIQVSTEVETAKAKEGQTAPGGREHRHGQGMCQARYAKKPRSVTVNWRVTHLEWGRVSLWNGMGS